MLGERERWAYGLPVLIGGGVGGYFSLAFEPPVYAAPGLALVLLALILRLERTSALRLVLVGILAVVLGIAAGSLRTAGVTAPMLERKIGPVMVTGTVAEREAREGGGSRLLLEDIALERLDPAQTPVRVRLNLRGVLLADLPPLGSRVSVLANLLPPAEPAAPGSYDFRRQAFFEQLGAYGQALRAPVILAPPPHEQTTFSAQRWRERMADRIAARLPGPEGAIAIALMTGERGAIDAKTNADMRGAGTAHMLSISGMHISMVGGFVFFLVRALLALSPWVALRFPIKQIAAVVGLMSVVTYTLLVGAPIPAQRAALMTGLVFVAVLLNRQALTLRTVALSATFILLLFPESLLNPGFQMSFAAITLLVAAYERTPEHGGDDDTDQAERPGWFRRLGRYVWGIVLTSVIAGVATMPYGAWHFHRLQLLGVPGNLLAVPLTGFIVMPAIVVAYALAPLGLDGWALDLTGWGLQGVLRSAAWVAQLPGANVLVPAFPLWVLVLMTLGGLWGALWRARPLRLIGGGVFLVGVALVPLTRLSPVALVSPEGLVAVRTQSDGLLHSDRTRPKGLAIREWSDAYNSGLPLTGWRDHARCDALGCVLNGSIAVPRRAVALPEDCARATILIVPEERAPRDCAAPVLIDRKALRQRGAHAVYPDGSVTTTRQAPARPWHPGVSASQPR